MEVDREVLTALALILIGVIFIFKPEAVGIIIGFFLILMGANSLNRSMMKGKHGWRKKA